MYEPSKELIEQIAKESWDNFWKDTFAANNKERYPNGIRVTYEEQKDATIAKNRGALSSPTILRALELYENQPQWQDKPDREGWWWEDLETDQEGFHPYKIIRVTRVWGELRVATSFLPTIDDYIGLYGETAKTKFLYIPEPEPYKGEE